MAPLVHAYAPPAVGQSDRGNESAKAGAGNFSVAWWRHTILLNCVVGEHRLSTVINKADMPRWMAENLYAILRKSALSLPIPFNPLTAH